MDEFRAVVDTAQMSSKLALSGGAPVRQTMLPYSRHWVSEDDIASVVGVLQSDWLTTGPRVVEFEKAFADFVGANEAVVVNSGTAALHAAMHALGIGPGDEVIVPTMTFAASANCVVFQGGVPVFADVDSGSLLLDPTHVREKITSRTKAIIVVDYAGQPCDYEALRTLAEQHGLGLVADACHSLGGTCNGQRVGTLANLNTFSLHAVKHMTTGEGGVITTDNAELAKRMRSFRNHGIDIDHRQREPLGTWFYEMVDLGYNYNMTDFQCALGMSQLSQLNEWIGRRRAIADRYNSAFAEIPSVEPLVIRTNVSSAYHLYVIQLKLDELRADRATIYRALRAEGIGANVHYIPVHLHPFYRREFKTKVGLCPVAEAAYERLLSLPIFPRMSDADVNDVIVALRKVVWAYAM